VPVLYHTKATIKSLLRLCVKSIKSGQEEEASYYTKAIIREHLQEERIARVAKKINSTKSSPVAKIEKRLDNRRILPRVSTPIPVKRPITSTPIQVDIIDPKPTSVDTYIPTFNPACDILGNEGDNSPRSIPVINNTSEDDNTKFHHNISANNDDNDIGADNRELRLDDTATAHTNSDYSHDIYNSEGIDSENHTIVSNHQDTHDLILCTHLNHCIQVVHLFPLGSISLWNIHARFTLLQKLHPNESPPPEPPPPEPPPKNIRNSIRETHTEEWGAGNTPFNPEFESKGIFNIHSPCYSNIPGYPYKAKTVLQRKYHKRYSQEILASKTVRYSPKINSWILRMFSI
jgi:hypothetical protein